MSATRSNLCVYMNLDYSIQIFCGCLKTHISHSYLQFTQILLFVYSWYICTLYMFLIGNDLVSDINLTRTLTCTEMACLGKAEAECQ